MTDDEATEGDQEGGGGCGIRGDELQPGEAEQPDRGGPLAEPGGQRPVGQRPVGQWPVGQWPVGGAAAQGDGEPVEGAERVDQAPYGAEEKGGRDESDPEQDVDGAGSGVAGGVVGTEEEVEQQGEGGGETEPAQGGAGGGASATRWSRTGRARPERAPRKRDVDQSRPSARKETNSAAKAPAKA